MTLDEANEILTKIEIAMKTAIDTDGVFMPPCSIEEAILALRVGVVNPEQSVAEMISGGWTPMQDFVTLIRTGIEVDDLF